MLIRPGVGQRVVIQEQSSGDVEGDENINGVVLVSSQDKEYPKQVQHPCQCVQNVPVTWSVYRNRNTKQY